MKKFSLIIILFFNILPMWKNKEITFLQIGKIQAQASQATALPQLLAYLRSTDLPYPNNRYNYSINGNAIQRVDLQNTTTNNIDFVRPADYRNNSDFNQYLTSHNVILPPASNEYPNPDGDVDWNQVKHDIDMLRFEQRMEAFANIQWWGNVAGQEPINNTPPCEETMYNISFFEDFYEGKMAPPYVNNPLSLGSTNLPCSNQFLLGGNIIHFNSSQLANISNYNFSENSLNAVTFNNGHIYKRAIVYDVIENKIEFDGYSTYCPDDYINYEYNLRNKRGSYNYVCFPNLSGLSSVEAKLAPTGEDFYKNVPDNLAGYSFTLPDSCIVPAQPGYSVIGTNSSNGNSCQTLDCAKVPNGTASIDNCGSCTGGTTGAIACSPTQCATNVIFNKYPNMLFGLDKFTNSNIPWKSIEEDKSDTLKILITPSNKFSTVIFKDTPTNIITVNPTSATSANFNLKLTASLLTGGVNKIEASVNANCNVDSTNIRKINIVTYKLVSKTVAVRLVHSKANLTLGYSGYISTNVSDVDIIKYLNEKTYCQGIVKWTVIRLPAKVIDFDLNRDGFLDTQNWMSSEMSIIRDSCRADIYDINLFLVNKGSFTGGTGFSDLNQKYAYVHADLSPWPVNTIAHEIGHSAFGFVHKSGDNNNVMYDYESATRTEFRKDQWDLMH
jgi:hypothetical protein